LGALGVARAAQFSWARTAQETFGLFERTAWQRVDATSRASAALTARAEIAAPPRLPELTHG
jgi:hypothetical protein